jgi:hypothetical protein
MIRIGVASPFQLHNDGARSLAGNMMGSRLLAIIATALIVALGIGPGQSQDRPAEAKPAAPAAAAPKAGESAKPAAPPQGEHVFEALAGSWAGGGIITLSSGGRERLRCRAHHTVGQGGRSLAMTVRCASDSYRIELAANVVNRRGRIFGSWSESSYGASGTVSGSAAGGRINATATSSSFTAGLAISTGGGRQSISITPHNAPITGVHVALRKM